MKKIILLLTLLAFVLAGCGTTAKVAVNKLDSIKTTGKEEGSIDKEFFKQMVAQKPTNVTIVDVRTPFEYNAGHFEGAKHIYINDMYDKGCPSITDRLPKEGYVVFVCASGARAGEMYFGLKDDCKYPEMNRLFFLDANIKYAPTGPMVQ